jgi:S-adenosylmethionine:diacylglycerol 3-amino-3-carboxypropyl transferase
MRVGEGGLRVTENNFGLQGYAIELASGTGSTTALLRRRFHRLSCQLTLKYTYEIQL